MPDPHIDVRELGFDKQSTASPASVTYDWVQEEYGCGMAVEWSVLTHT